MAHFYFLLYRKRLYSTSGKATQDTLHYHTQYNIYISLQYTTSYIYYNCMRMTM